jgi:hypothetical protein
LGTQCHDALRESRDRERPAIPTKDIQHGPAHVRVPLAVRATRVPHPDGVHRVIRMELADHGVEGGKVRVELQDAGLRRLKFAGQIGAAPYKSASTRSVMLGSRRSSRAVAERLGVFAT